MSGLTDLINRLKSMRKKTGSRRYPFFPGDEMNAKLTARNLGRSVCCAWREAGEYRVKRVDPDGRVCYLYAIKL